MDNTFTKENPELPIIIAAFAATYIIWGSTYMANKVIVMELPPFLLAGIRFLTASLIVFVLAKASGQKLLIPRLQMRNAVVAGFLFLTFGNGLAVWALKYVESGFTAILISTQPLVLLLLMRIIDKKPIKIRSLVGVAFGIVGIALLVSQSTLTTGPDTWKGLFMITLCLLSWGWGSMFVGRVELPKNAFLNGAWQMLFGGIMMFVISFGLGEPTSGLATISPKAMWAMLYLILFGSVVAFTAFNYLLVRISPEKVATNTYVNPLVAMICGWYFLDEKITFFAILATVLLLTGVYFINSARFSRRKH